MKGTLTDLIYGLFSAAPVGTLLTYESVAEAVGESAAGYEARERMRKAGNRARDRLNKLDGKIANTVAGSGWRIENGIDHYRYARSYTNRAISATRKEMVLLEGVDRSALTSEQENRVDNALFSVSSRFDLLSQDEEVAASRERAAQEHKVRARKAREEWKECSGDLWADKIEW